MTDRDTEVVAARRRVVNMLDAQDLTEICLALGISPHEANGIPAMRRVLIDRWTDRTTGLVLDLLENNIG